MSDKIKDGGPAFPRSPRSGIYEGEYDGMTLRQYAAIKLRVPNSGTDWLDEMIRQSMRNELAAKHMQALSGTVFYTDGNLMPKEVAQHAHEISDAMLKAREVA